MHAVRMHAVRMRATRMLEAQMRMVYVHAQRLTSTRARAPQAVSATREVELPRPAPCFKLEAAAMPTPRRNCRQLA